MLGCLTNPCRRDSEHIFSIGWYMLNLEDRVEIHPSVREFQPVSARRLHGRETEPLTRASLSGRRARRRPLDASSRHARLPAWASRSRPGTHGSRRVGQFANVGPVSSERDHTLRR